MSRWWCDNNIILGNVYPEGHTDSGPFAAGHSKLIFRQSYLLQSGPDNKFLEGGDTETSFFDIHITLACQCLDFKQKLNQGLLRKLLKELYYFHISNPNSFLVGFIIIDQIYLSSSSSWIIIHVYFQRIPLLRNHDASNERKY